MTFFNVFKKTSSLNNYLDEEITSAEIENVVKEVSKEQANKKLALAIAIQYIANAISQCEFKVYENEVKVKNTQSYLLNVQPNKNQNANEFKSKLVCNLLFVGEALIVEKNNQFYVADNFTRNKNGFKEDTFSNITVDTESIVQDIKANKVFYFKLNDFKIKNLIDSWNLNFEELINYAYEKFKDITSKKYKLSMQTTKAGDTKFQEEYEQVIKKQLKDFVESRTAIYPEFQGYKLEDMTDKNLTSNVGDVTGLKKEIFETVAQAFLIPTQMMIGNVSNLNDVVNMFLTNAVDPLSEMIGTEITRKTVTQKDYEKGNYTKVDTSKILHIDIFNSADKIDKLIASGYSSIDDVREITGQEKLNTEFSQQHWITKNYSKIEDVLEGQTENQ